MKKNNCNFFKVKNFYSKFLHNIFLSKIVFRQRRILEVIFAYNNVVNNITFK
jgi:hypothetical protein